MAQSDDEDDYMNMVFDDVKPTGVETSLQRRVRLQREGEERGRIKSKAEREADEAFAREQALSTAIDTSNKGFKMMAKLGFKPGDTLGKAHDARKEPIRVTVKEDRGGIGHASEKKRKFREQMEAEAKRVKVQTETQEEYLERVRQEHKDRHVTGQFYEAQKVAERLDEEAKEQSLVAKGKAKKADDYVPLNTINIVYRGLVRYRYEKEMKERAQKELQTSLPRLSTVDDDDDDLPFNVETRKDRVRALIETELDEEDEELNRFNALPPAERLEKVVEYLREEYNYCFFCKYRYPDAEMEGCPGLNENEHD